MLSVCFTVGFLTCCNKVTVWLPVGWKLQDHYCRVLFQCFLLGDDYFPVHIRIWHSVWFPRTQIHERLISFPAVCTYEWEKLSQSIKTHLSSQHSAHSAVLSLCLHPCLEQGRMLCHLVCRKLGISWPLLSGNIACTKVPNPLWWIFFFLPTSQLLLAGKSWSSNQSFH